VQGKKAKTAWDWHTPNAIVREQPDNKDAAPRKFRGFFAHALGDGMAQSFHAGRNDALLTDAESEELAALTAEGRYHQAGLWLVLKRIHDKALYREFGTWEAYCLEEWEIGRQRAYEIIRAAAVVANLECTPLAYTQLPTSERQIRLLTTLKTPEAQREVWQEAVATATDGKVTGKHVATTVARLYPKASAVEEVPFTGTTFPTSGNVSTLEAEDVATEQEGEETPEAYKAQLAGMPNTNQIRTWLMDVQRTTDKHAPTEVALLVKARVSKTEQRLEKKRMVRLAAWLVEYAEAVGGVSDKP